MKKQSIERYLKQFKGERVVFVPNPGNAGDALIACATFQMLKSLGVNYIEGDDMSSYPDQIIIYGGGGNLVKPYKNALRFLERNHLIAKKLIILPHTIRSYGDFLAGLGANVDVFSREVESYKYCANHIKHAGLFLSDDMGFYLDVDSLMNFCVETFGSRLTYNEFFTKNLKRSVRELVFSIKSRLSRNEINSFRRDVEKTEALIPVNNIDISQSHSCDNMSERCVYECICRMLCFMNKYDEINTNRLHVCIAGILLGKRVNFYDNSYGKNYNVYEASIMEAYNNVVWNG